MPSAEPSSVPSLDVEEATIILFNASLTLDSVSSTSWNHDADLAVEGGIAAIGDLKKTDIVTVLGARQPVAQIETSSFAASSVVDRLEAAVGMKQRLLVDSTVVVYSIELRTNNHSYPLLAYDSFSSNLATGISSGVFTEYLKDSGSTVLVSATVSVESIVVEEPVVVYAPGREPPAEPADKELPPFVLPGSIALGVAILSACLLYAYYRRKQKVVPDRPTSFFDPRDFDESINPAPVPKPTPLELYVEEEMEMNSILQQMHNKGYRAKKMWDFDDGLHATMTTAKGTDATEVDLFSYEASEKRLTTSTKSLVGPKDPNFTGMIDTTTTESATTTTDELEPALLLRPPKVSVRKLEDIEDSGSDTDADLLEQMEQRITPKPRSKKGRGK